MCLCNMGWRLLDCPWLSRMRDDDGGDDVDAGVRLRRSDSCLVFESAQFTLLLSAVYQLFTSQPL